MDFSRYLLGKVSLVTGLSPVYIQQLSFGRRCNYLLEHFNVSNSV